MTGQESQEAALSGWPWAGCERWQLGQDKGLCSSQSSEIRMCGGNLSDSIRLALLFSEMHDWKGKTIPSVLGVIRVVTVSYQSVTFGRSRFTTGF